MAPVQRPEGAGPPPQAWRTIGIQALKLQACIGVLEHERHAPQPIEVDAQLHLGLLPLIPPHDSIEHVLDYRQVRQAIIEVCQRGHTQLLETLAGLLCERLLQLPGVTGVSVRLCKSHIFDDCQAAISVQAGRLPPPLDPFYASH